MMNAVRTSQTSVYFNESTRCHISKDCRIHIQGLLLLSNKVGGVGDNHTYLNKLQVYYVRTVEHIDVLKDNIRSEFIYRKDKLK
jgi:hypothetical protein